jgi:hypothetical protein
VAVEGASQPRTVRPMIRATASPLLAGVVALAIALGQSSPAAAVTPASASGSDPPAAKNCVNAKEAGAHASGGAAPLRFTAAFYARVFTLDASLDGLNGKQLPVSIQDVCDIPRSLTSQAVQLAGADGVALLSARTSVWLGARQLRGRAATTAVGGADTAVLRVRLAPRRRWVADEDGVKVATFLARRITITD